MSFLQGFRFKKTVRLAPDALVFVNQKLTAPLCSECGGERSFQNDVASINVDMNVDAPPGSATITIPVPRHGFHLYDTSGRGNLIFKPMQEIEIFMRGRWTVNGEPKYYPVFWGIITQVTQEKGVDSWLIQIQCQDVLKWWELTTMNVNPAIIQLQEDGRTPQLMKHDFANFNPYETIMALALIGFGDIIGPKSFGLADNSQFVALLQKETVEYGEAVIRYWQRRFASMARRLKIFGVNGYRLNRDVKDVDLNQFAREFWQQANGQRSPNSRLPGLFYDQDQFSRYRPDEFIGSGVALKESVEKTKMEIALETKQHVGFEFFVDMNGDIVFKPPFYNMDVRTSGPVYTLQEEDIISFSINENSDLIRTRLDVYGRFVQLTQDAGAGEVYGYYIDYDLARRYGIRNEQENRGDLRTARSCYAYAVSELSRWNAKAKSATVTIIGRPELRLGRPVYVPHEDAFFYITGINHSFTFGGQFQTTLTLIAARFPYIPVDQYRKEESLGTTEGVVDESQVITKDRQGGNFFGGRLGFLTVTFPNRIMVFRGVPNEDDADAGARPVPTNVSGQPISIGLPGGPARPQFNDQYTRFYTDAGGDSVVARMHKEAVERGEIFGTAQGLWEEVEDTTKKIFSATHEVIPVSDEGGYVHVGGFPYGRGMTIGALEQLEVTELAGEVEAQPDAENPTITKELGLNKRAASVAEQYGLESGVAPTFGSLDPKSQRPLSTPQTSPSEGWTAEELSALKESSVSLRDRFRSDTQANTNCDCGNEKYTASVIANLILARKTGGQDDPDVVPVSAAQPPQTEPELIEESLRIPEPPEHFGESLRSPGF